MGLRIIDLEIKKSLELILLTMAFDEYFVKKLNDVQNVATECVYSLQRHHDLDEE